MYSFRVNKGGTVQKCSGHIFTQISFCQLFFSWSFCLSDFICDFFPFLSFPNETILSNIQFSVAFSNKPLVEWQASCLPPYSPHLYRSPLSLIPSIEPYWEGLDASRYRPQPSSPQWVCYSLSPCSCTLYIPLCTLIRSQAPQIPDLTACFWQNFPTRQQLYWSWSAIDEWWS